VDLVEVDRVEPEAREAALDLSPERVAVQALQRRPVRAFRLPALGEDERPLVEAGDRAADDLLGVAEAVLGRRVDPVDAELERAMDRGDRVVVVLVAPTPVVLRAAERPGAETDAVISIPVRPSSVVLMRPR
jgi:hypothetical protein